VLKIRGCAGLVRDNDTGQSIIDAESCDSVFCAVRLLLGFNVLQLMGTMSEEMHFISTFKCSAPMLEIEWWPALACEKVVPRSTSLVRQGLGPLKINLPLFRSS